MSKTKKEIVKVDDTKDLELIKGNPEEEIIVKWVNKYGIPIDIKTRKGGLIHALWMAEHEKRTRKRLEQQPEQPDIIAIETEVTKCEPKQLKDADHPNH